MTPRTIFTLILKIIGLYVAFNLFVFIPQLFSQIPYLWMNPIDTSEVIMIILGLIAIILVYFLLMRLFLFKTNWIIDKLSLDKHFDQDIINIKLDSAAVIQIAIIVLGGLYFADAFPSLFREIVTFLQQKEMDITLARSYGLGYMVFDACKLTLGYLLITNSKWLTLWIEEKNKSKDENDISIENRENL